MPRLDIRAAATARLSEESGQGLSQNVLSLLSADDSTIVRPSAVRNIPVDRVDPNPNQPRMALDQASLDDLTASVKEHGVLQPVLVRPLPAGRYQLVAGERRWRAAMAASLTVIPALIEEIDDDTALEISVIENLQREDLSPLDEALIYDKMIHQHGYSIRKLAQKIGKDKGYLENRLRLADAPQEIRDLVSVRKDTLSHAYELLKVADSRKRQRLAGMVARGELSLVKLREKIEQTPRPPQPAKPAPAPAPGGEPTPAPETDSTGTGPQRAQSDDALVAARSQLTESIAELVSVIQSDAMKQADETDRQNLIKFLMIARVRLENAITLVRRSALDS